MIYIVSYFANVGCIAFLTFGSSIEFVLISYFSLQTVSLLIHFKELQEVRSWS